MRVCQRNSWTLATWRALQDDEKTEWLAWDRSYLDASRQLRNQLIDAKAVSGDAAVQFLRMIYGD